MKELNQFEVSSVSGAGTLSEWATAIKGFFDGLSGEPRESSTCTK